MSGLRVVTWNVRVRTARGLGGRVDFDRVARVLAPLDADLIALQKLDVGRARPRATLRSTSARGERRSSPA